MLAAVGVLEDEATFDARAPEGHVPVLADVLNGEQMANGVNTRCKYPIEAVYRSQSNSGYLIWLNYQLKELLLVEGLYEYLEHELVRCRVQKLPFETFLTSRPYLLCIKAPIGLMLLHLTIINILMQVERRIQHTWP